MSFSDRLTVAILCGGRGTRLQERTREIPKPLVEIGGEPILRHVIEIFAGQGFGRVVLLLGYRGELIEQFVAAASLPPGLEVVCVPTGIDTQTGGRLKLAAEHLPAETFCVTYADGLADVDLSRLLAFHSGHGGMATMTVVQPQLGFGVAEIDPDDRVTGFHEKPRADVWINGGFFCFEPGVLELLEVSSVLERDPLERLAASGQLHAYRHDGFWACMDTYKDALMLNDLWSAGQAPWQPRDRTLG